MSNTPGGNAPGSRRPGGGPPEGKPGPQRQAGLQPTKATTLVVAAVAAGLLAWWGMSTHFADIPNINWLPGLTLAALAVVESIAAHNTRARIEKRPRAGAVNPLQVARYAVLAKASSLAGAIFAGAYGGVSAWALSEHGQLRVADADLPPAIAGLVGALGLVAAALLLERACRVPEPPDDDENSAGSGGSGGGTPGSRR